MKMSKKRNKFNRRKSRRRNVDEMLKEQIAYMKDEQESMGFVPTKKDEALGIWINERIKQIQETNPEDTFLFAKASTAVAEFETLYDSIKRALDENFPQIDTDEFFRNIKMYIGDNDAGDTYYATDWKTVMFTIAGFINKELFPVMGLDFNLRIYDFGMLEIVDPNEFPIVHIPVNKRIDNIYIKTNITNRNKELKNGNIKNQWDRWYTENKKQNTEKELIRFIEYYDEILEYTKLNDLFNAKKIFNTKGE